MKISFLIPEKGIYIGNKNWLWWVYEELKKLNNEILFNDCSEDCDVMICMSISIMKILDKLNKKYPNVPIITYNWDWFSFIDKTTPKWLDFIKWMKKSIDIWTASNDTARLCEKELGLKHYTIYACAVFEEFKNTKIKNGNYVVQASRRDERYKRFSLFEKGCEDLKIPYISCHPDKYSREEYIKILSECKLLIMAANEESNATLSSIEAAFCKKPLLLSDLNVCKECWEDKAIYFKTDNLEDFKNKLKKLYNGEIKSDIEGAYKLAMEKYIPKIMASTINKRLKEILC